MADAMKLVPVEPTEAMIEAAGDAPWSDARRAATNVYDRRNITVADMLRAGIAAAPSAPQGVRFDVEAYVENYEFRSDEGDHTPDENERGMLIDAIHGVLSELEPASPPAREEAPVERAGGAIYDQSIQGFDRIIGYRTSRGSECDPAAPGEGVGFSVDDLAQEIRRVDGNHDLGAGALAEALMPFLRARTSEPAREAVAWDCKRFGITRDPICAAKWSLANGPGGCEPLYTHPAPATADKLKVAKEALKPFAADHECDGHATVSDYDLEVSLFVRYSKIIAARQALATLNEEG